MPKDHRILFLVSQNSPRLTYILRIFFQQLLNIEPDITISSTFFNQSMLPKINYSNQVVQGKGLTILPSSILFERNITPQQFELNASLTTTKNGDQQILSFDILAASFYLISRYEEYLPFKADTHGRFRASQSIAFQQHFLERPLINLWSLEIKKILLSLFPTLKMSPLVYQPLITYDIDIAWAYLNRSVYRTIGATFKDLSSNIPSFQNRIKTFLNIRKDPFDTFEYIFNQHKKHDLTAHFFFLLGQYGKFDKNINPHSKALHQLISKTLHLHTVGIHPSYGSNTSYSQLVAEHQILSTITNHSIDESRQHYLKLAFPTTYQRLIQLGIKKDYTMGYADAVGFRASIATPFRWFNVEKNEATNLIIYPFQVMDVTLKNYLALNPEQAILVIQKMILACKEVGGCFSSIWHNSSLSELNGWNKWITVYEQMLRDARV